MEHERKFSKVEALVFEFAASKYAELEHEKGDSLFKHQENVAIFLYDHGYRGKYVFTALCQNLLNDTNTRSEEIRNTCGQITEKAVRLLDQYHNDPKNTDLINKNEVASIVKIADLLITMNEMMTNASPNAALTLSSMDECFTKLTYHEHFIEDFEFRKEKLKIHILLSQAKDLDKMPKPVSLRSDSKFDHLEILIKKEKVVDGQVYACDIYINGERFIDIIAKDERGFGYQESMCGSYIGLPPHAILLPERTFIDLESNLYLDDDGRVHTLACGDCGLSECWTVPVKITAEENTVTWSDFGLKTGKVGPYTFDRAQYEHALDHGNAAYASAYCYANGIRVQKDASMMREMFQEALLYGNKQALDFLQSLNKINHLN